MDINMDEDLQKSLRGFDKLWDRMTTASGDDLSAEASMDALCQRYMREFMDTKCQGSLFYTKLAECLTGPVRAAILKIAREEKEHLKTMQTEYFLLVGDSYIPDKAKLPRINGAVTALRDACRDKREREEKYIRAVRDINYSGIQMIFGNLALEERNHAERIKQLIIQTME